MAAVDRLVDRITSPMLPQMTIEAIILTLLFMPARFLAARGIAFFRERVYHGGMDSKN
jgi:hypothetical protein